MNVKNFYIAIGSLVLILVMLSAFDAIMTDAHDPSKLLNGMADMADKAAGR